MAGFSSHLTQARHNLAVLSWINQQQPNPAWDWQVTTCFYTALHLVNAYLAERIGAHYMSHGKVNEALNFASLSPTRLAQDDYLAYRKLQALSRRSRYLCLDADNREQLEAQSGTAFLTYDKHLARAVKNLHRLLDFFVRTYPHEQFVPCAIKCIELKGFTSPFFAVNAN